MIGLTVGLLASPDIDADQSMDGVIVQSKAALSTEATPKNNCYATGLSHCVMAGEVRP
jgi:hypothetical protein